MAERMTLLGLQLRQLRKVEAEYRAATQHAEQLRQARNQAILEALAGGWTHASIAEATGLSRGRIGQMAQRQDWPVVGDKTGPERTSPATSAGLDATL